MIEKETYARASLPADSRLLVSEICFNIYFVGNNCVEPPSAVWGAEGLSLLDLFELGGIFENVWKKEGGDN